MESDPDDQAGGADSTRPVPNRDEMSEEDFEAAEIERVFGPVDEKQQDVEQV